MVRVYGQTYQEVRLQHGDKLNVDYWFELAVNDCHTRRKAAIMRATRVVADESTGALTAH